MVEKRKRIPILLDDPDTNPKRERGRAKYHCCPRLRFGLVWFFSRQSGSARSVRIPYHFAGPSSFSMRFSRRLIFAVAAAPSKNPSIPKVKPKIPKVSMKYSSVEMDTARSRTPVCYEPNVIRRCAGILAPSPTEKSSAVRQPNGVVDCVKRAKVTHTRVG